MRNTRTLIALLLLLWALPLSADHGDAVLILHSYHQGFLWTDTIEAGIRRAFAREEGKYVLYTEYLDTKRFPPAEREGPFTDYLRRKYDGVDFRAVIVSDDNAWAYFLDHRDDLFPGLPAVFCGLNNFDAYPGDRPALTTGIAEDFDVAANLELIADLHGENTLVAVVADGTASGTLNLGRFALAAENDAAPRLQYDILFDLSAGELTRRLELLPEEAVILNLGFWRDSEDRAFNHRESISLMTDSGLPVYTCWDHMIRFGAVGGIGIDGELQGRQAAEYALQILDGRAPSSLPVKRRDLTTPIFDYRALKEHDIPFGRLPRDRVIRNLPNRIYYRYPLAFTIVISSLSILAILVLLLILNILLRKQAEQLFRTLFESAPDVILVHDRTGRILMANRAVERIHGYSVEETLRMNVRDLDAPEFVDGFEDRLERQMSSRQYECEVDHIGRDGRRIEFESSAVQVQYRGQSVVMAVLRDIGDRNLSRRRLESSAREKEILLKEIHHRVKNNLQIIVSLLRLQTDTIGDSRSAAVLQNSQNRISAMAAVHEMLYQSEDLASISAPEYLTALTSQLEDSFRDENLRVDSRLEIAPVSLPVDQAIPVGLMVTELITNSLKYGVVDGSGRYDLELRTHEGFIILRQRDYGPGFDFAGRNRSSLGLELVETLASQLDGTLSHDGGSEFTLIFPRQSG